jgi:hypothetical protein
MCKVIACLSIERVKFTNKQHGDRAIHAVILGEDGISSAVIFIVVGQFTVGENLARLYDFFRWRPLS